jgi:hypothetical protein
MVSVNGVKIADLGFYINLDKRTDRKEKIEKQLDELNIVGVQRHSAFSNHSSGPCNCKQSHYDLYKKLLESEWETLLVLEDDCLFLDRFQKKSEEVFTELYKIEWDIFWLGCRNRRSPKPYQGSFYKTSSVSHAQSYIIKRHVCEYILENFPVEHYSTTAVDELLCLLPFGKDVVSDPNSFGYYQMDQPLDNLPTNLNSICYESSLTTQYASFSDLWQVDVNYEEYISNSFPKNN